MIPLPPPQTLHQRWSHQHQHWHWHWRRHRQVPLSPGQRRLRQRQPRSRCSHKDSSAPTPTPAPPPPRGLRELKGPPREPKGPCREPKLPACVSPCLDVSPRGPQPHRLLLLLLRRRCRLPLRPPSPAPPLLPLPLQRPMLLPRRPRGQDLGPLQARLGRRGLRRKALHRPLPLPPLAQAPHTCAGFGGEVWY